VIRDTVTAIGDRGVLPLASEAGLGGKSYGVYRVRHPLVHACVPYTAPS
jgi:hypothetical protein